MMGSSAASATAPTRLALIYLPYLLFPLGCVVLFSV